MNTNETHTYYSFWDAILHWALAIDDEGVETYNL